MIERGLQLQHRRPRQEVVDHGVPGFMISHQLFLFFCHHFTLLLRSGDFSFHGLFHGFHRDLWFIFTHRKQCRLIDDIGQIRTGKAWCSLGNDLKRDIISKGLPVTVYFKNRFSSFDIRR